MYKSTNMISYHSNKHIRTPQMPQLLQKCSYLFAWHECESTENQLQQAETDYIREMEISRIWTRWPEWGSWIMEIWIHHFTWVGKRGSYLTPEECRERERERERREREREREGERERAERERERERRERKRERERERERKGEREEIEREREMILEHRLFISSSPPISRGGSHLDTRERERALWSCLCCSLTHCLQFTVKLQHRNKQKWNG